MTTLSAGWGLDEDRAEWRSRVVLETAQRALGVAIAGADRQVPCLVPGLTLWLSERRSERREAARRCVGCPVLTECGAVGAAAPLETWGVFGGHDYASDLEDLVELRALGRASFNGGGGAAIRARRNELLIRLGIGGGWSTAELAEAAGLSIRRTCAVLGQAGRRCGGREGKRGPYRRRRMAVIGAEVAVLDGPLLRKLRGLGRPAAGPAGDADRLVRDRVLWQLWNGDPEFWTHERLAAAAGLTPPVAGP